MKLKRRVTEKPEWNSSIEIFMTCLWTLKWFFFRTGDLGQYLLRFVCLTTHFRIQTKIETPCALIGVKRNICLVQHIACRKSDTCLKINTQPICTQLYLRDIPTAPYPNSCTSQLRNSFCLKFSIWFASDVKVWNWPSRCKIFKPAIVIEHLFFFCLSEAILDILSKLAHFQSFFFR